MSLLCLAPPELPASVPTVSPTDFYNWGPLVLAGCLLWQDPFDKGLLTNPLHLHLQGIHINFSECSLRILCYFCLGLDYSTTLALLPQGMDSQTSSLQINPPLKFQQSSSQNSPWSASPMAFTPQAKLRKEKSHFKSLFGTS